MIYLDNASTTQVDERVIEEMRPYLASWYGNAGALHSLGIKSHNAIEKARKQAADFINAKPDQVVFTSGGTESNNMVLYNAMLNSVKDKRKIIVSEVEHDSILRLAGFFAEEFGLEIPLISVNEDGTVNMDELLKNIDETTVLVSVMMMNNELGSLNNVKEIAKECHKKGILFHCDATQAAGIVPIDVRDIDCDFLTVSGHKIHAPKGTGMLFIKNRKDFIPLIFGGSHQEFGLRGGTENVPGIVAFGKACEIEKKFEKDQSYIARLKYTLWNQLSKQMNTRGLLEIMHDNAGSASSYGKVLSVRFDGVDAEAVVLMLSSRGVYVSAGSACKSHEQEPSRILTHIGLTPVQARSTIRISLSRMNTQDECEDAAETIADVVATLRRM